MLQWKSGREEAVITGRISLHKLETVATNKLNFRQSKQTIRWAV